MKQKKKTTWKNLLTSIMLQLFFSRYKWFVDLEKLFMYHDSYLFICPLVIGNKTVFCLIGWYKFYMKNIYVIKCVPLVSYICKTH